MPCRIGYLLKLLVQDEKSQGPRLRVEQGSVSRCSTAHRWKIVWSVENLGPNPLRILAGRLPHSQFRSEEHYFPRFQELPTRARTQVEFLVDLSGAPGSIIENAFLILRVLWSEKECRVLVRLRVHLDKRGHPRCVTEVITTHQIGFSTWEKTA